MNRSSRTLCAAILLLSAAWGYATTGSSRDPQVIIAGGHGSFPVGSLFSFVSPTGSSPITLKNGSPCVVRGIAVPDCLFRNGSGFRWSSLTFFIKPGGQTGPFTCIALAYFKNCFFNKLGTMVTFSGGEGIDPGDDFVVAVVSWLQGTAFEGVASRAGVPASWGLPHGPALPSEPGNAALLMNDVVFLRQRRLRARDVFAV